MGALIRRFGRVSRVRAAMMGALVLGMLLGTVLAFGLASSSTALPFALSAARPSTPTSPANEQARTTYQAVTVPSECGTPAPAARGQSINETLSVGGSARDYRLHVPRTYAPDEPIPLLLAFHAHGMTAAAFERYSRLSQLADTRGFVVAYPQGVRGADGQTGWNTYRHQDPNTDDVGFVNALITHLQETLCVDPQRIYATGFSNGGGFVSVLACDLSARIAAFAPDAGDYYPQSRQTPATTIRSLEDATHRGHFRLWRSTGRRIPSIHTTAARNWATQVWVRGCRAGRHVTTARENRCCALRSLA